MIAPSSNSCTECGATSLKRVSIDYFTKMKYEGTNYDVRVSNLMVLECAICGEKEFSPESRRQLRNALCDLLGLLKPSEIRAKRESLGLSQVELARLMGVANETISRWESAALVQSRASDRFLRSVFAVPGVRTFLAGDAIGEMGHWTLMAAECEVDDFDSGWAFAA